MVASASDFGRRANANKDHRKDVLTTFGNEPMKTKNHLIYKALTNVWKLTGMKTRLSLSACIALTGLLLSTAVAHADDTCVRSTDDAIMSRFNRWNLALASMDTQALASLYWNDAVLVSDPHQGEIAGSQALSVFFSELMHSHPRTRVEIGRAHV